MSGPVTSIMSDATSNNRNNLNDNSLANNNTDINAQVNSTSAINKTINSIQQSSAQLQTSLKEDSGTNKSSAGQDNADTKNFQDLEKLSKDLQKMIEDEGQQPLANNNIEYTNKSLSTENLSDSNIQSSQQSGLTFEDEAIEIKSLEDKLLKSICPQDLKDRSLYMLSRLKRMQRTGSFSAEYDIISNYIDWITRFPWNQKCNEVLDINRVKQVLDSNHYGLELVKDKIYQYMSVRILLSQKKDFEALKRSSVLCMVGLQGIGKTTIAKSIAAALNRPFYRISMGAIGSVLEIRGRNKGIEGAEPGQVVKAIINTGVINPVILLDELDKASGQAGLLADVMATMLEILDPEQNTKFRDHYFDYPIDLSEVMFIVSANKSGTFSAALLDRMEVIKMPSYTDEEKLVIARDYLLPRVRKTTGILEDQLIFSQDVWPLILRPLGFDSGIRSLQRILENMASKAALEIVQGKATKVEINPANFRDYLPKY